MLNGKFAQSLIKRYAPSDVGETVDVDALTISLSSRKQTIAEMVKILREVQLRDMEETYIFATNLILDVTDSEFDELCSRMNDEFDDDWDFAGFLYALLVLCCIAMALGLVVGLLAVAFSVL